MADFNLTINPAQAEFILKPGAALLQAYDIINNSENTLYLTTSVEPWQPSGSSGNLSYFNVPSNDNLHFSLNNADLNLGQTFALQPHQKRQLVLKIKPDSQILEKDYYYTFFVSQAPANQPNLDSNQTRTSAKIGSHLLLSLSQTENLPVRAEITDFTVSPKIKDCFLTPINFSALIKNQTPNFFKTEGRITVFKNNKEIARLDLSPQNVLGQHSRSILCSPATACILKPPFWPGAYTASISLSATDSAKPLTSTFYIFPFSLLLSLIPLLLLFVILINKKSKKQN
ncbi:MAG: hypothetical protein ACOX6N_00765 [Patescibacteria group bacterium]|jgi:hypothetical protein